MGVWDNPYLRPFENPANGAANQQAELLGEKHPGDLTQGRVRLTLQVQNGRSEERDAESKAEENTPVGKGVVGIPFEQRHDSVVHKHLGQSEDGYFGQTDVKVFVFF